MFRQILQTKQFFFLFCGVHVFLNITPDCRMNRSTSVTEQAETMDGPLVSDLKESAYLANWEADLKMKLSFGIQPCP